jgi:hypothetical protein
MAEYYEESENERDRDSERKAKQRALARDIKIPPCANPKRRAENEKNVFHWLQTYLSKDWYKNLFTDQQSLIVEDIRDSAIKGYNQAIAAPRGEGKSTICWGVILFAILTGEIDFELLVAASGRDAERGLNNIKQQIKCNDVLLEDYPEVIIPLREVSRSPRRSQLQTVKGKYTDITWAKDHIIFPTVEGSRSSGAIIAARGIDSAFRGFNINGKRPKHVLVDDPETRESAASDVQIQTREMTVEKDIAGLVGPGEKMGTTILCTPQNRKCVSFRFTDPSIKPAFNGKKYAALVRLPDNRDLMEEYIILRKECQQAGDKDATAANEFYQKRRDEIEAGAIVSNEYNKSGLEVSALQHYYNVIEKIGWNNFLTEYQNDPPEDDEVSGVGLTDITIINKQLRPLEDKTELERGMIPDPDRIKRITAAIDVGKYSCHWEVKAHYDNDASHTIDYGVLEVKGTELNQDKEQVDKAIYRALSEFREQILNSTYVEMSPTNKGEIRQVNLVLIDSGDFTDAVYRFCLNAGPPFFCSKGFGDNYRITERADRLIGNHFYVNPVVASDNVTVPLYHLDSNYWKHQVHDGWLTPIYNDDNSRRANSLSLFSVKEKSKHHSFAKHILAEEYQETFVKGGKGLVRKWIKVNKNNHWLDCNYMNLAAREICKVHEIHAENQRRANIAAQTKKQSGGSGWEIKGW